MAHQVSVTPFRPGMLPDLLIISAMGSHVIVLQGTKEIDAFICQLGRVLRWNMPPGRVEGLQMRRHIASYGTVVSVSFEHVSIQWTKYQADELFSQLCKAYAWVDA